MVRSMFAGVAGLRTHQSKLDVIGNNVANVNTWGFKAGSANFMDSLYTNNTNSTGGASAAAGGQGGTNASQVGYGVQMSSISRDFSKSTPYQTGNEMDVMIDGTGFLIVGSSTGENLPIAPGGGDNAYDLTDAGIMLSRVGILTVDNEGYLVDNQRNYIYGIGVDASTDDIKLLDAEQGLVRLRIPAKTGNDQYTNEDAELYELKNYRILADGTVVGYSTDGEKKVTIGKIALADVQNVNGLESNSGYYYKVGDNAGTCTWKESNAIMGTFLSGYLEMPNVDLAKEFSEMITTERGFQANTKIITVTDEMLQDLVNMKR